MAVAVSVGVTVGLVGGGQLGRLLIQAGSKLGVAFQVLDPDPHCPAAALAQGLVTAAFDDEAALEELAGRSSLLGLDIEAPPAEALARLEARGVTVMPSSRVLGIIQDKGVQRRFFSERGLTQPRFQWVEGSLIEAVKNFGMPCVLKARRQGYDGRGVHMVSGVDDPVLKTWAGDALLEEKMALAKELAVVVVRGQDGAWATYDPVEMVMDPQRHLLDTLLAPARISATLAERARAIAVGAVEALQGVGVFGVELFLDQAGELSLNEVSPRVHNSGHHTIEACACSQFENHLRAMLGLPLGDVRTLHAAAMVNLLGPDGLRGPYRAEGLAEVEAMPGTAVHLYGKRETRPGRKLGHLTVTAATVEQAQTTAQAARRHLRFVEEQ